MSSNSRGRKRCFIVVGMVKGLRFFLQEAIGEGLHTLGKEGVVGEEVPDAILAEDTALEVGRQEAALVVGKVLPPFVAAEVGGEDAEVVLYCLVTAQGFVELLDCLKGLVETLFHFADA